MGVRLSRARLAGGMSQEQVAFRSGISSYTYQKFENGESQPGAPANPSLMTLLSICQTLDITIEDLLPIPPDMLGGN